MVRITAEQKHEVQQSGGFLQGDGGGLPDQGLRGRGEGGRGGSERKRERKEEGERAGERKRREREEEG